MNYAAAEKYALDLLKEKLPPTLLYHNIAHTLDVMESCVHIGTSEKVSIHELTLLKTAAVFHDTGFTERYEKNEGVGCRIAELALKDLGYVKRDIDIICEIIMATELSASPNNLLHEIIRDADLDYLGRDDFFRISGNLRKELQLHGTSYSDKEWYHQQVKFLENHYYSTLTAKAERQSGKQKNLEQIKRLIRLG